MKNQPAQALFAHAKAGERFPSRHEAVIRVFLLVAIFATAVALDAFRPQAEYSVKGVAYDSTIDAPREIKTPVDLPLDFRLQFDAFSDGVTGGGDLLQASGRSGTVLRLVVQAPHRLCLVLFGMDALPITITDSFAPHRWHHFALTGIRKGRFELAVDGVIHYFEMSAIQQLQSSATIGSKDFTFRFSRLEVGPGSTLGPFRGKIANLSLTSLYVKPMSLPLAALGDALVVFAVLWLMRPWLLRIREPDVSSSNVIALAILVGFAGLGFFADSVGLPGGNWAILLAMGSGTICAVVLAGRARSVPFSRRVSGLVAIFLAGLVVSFLVTLPNWITTARMFERWPLATMFAVALALCTAAIVVDASARGTASAVDRRSRWFPYVPYALFALLALRTDSIFAQINALHWEYFVGPIRAVREGGWLLWDVASQYGFLNIVIPSLFPFKSAVNAFYWFQAFAFFAVSATFYRVLYGVLCVNWFAACALVVSFFFLADPLLIGPTAYPSMSAVRFLWCYVLLAIAATNFLGSRPSVARFARSGTLAWIVGMLWSAEGAVYASVIFFTPLCLSIVVRREKTLLATLLAAVKLFRLPVLCALVAFGVVDIIYLIALRHLPDWSMFVAYSRSYGGGFGERPIPLYGPIWAITAVLFGGVGALLLMRGKAVEGPAYATATALAVVWIVSSYYVGRAYPVVVTMLSPLIVFAVFTIVRAGGILGKNSLQAAVAIPFVALGLVSTFWNAEAPIVVSKIAVPNVDASSRLPLANSELASLLAAARVVRSTPVVYYDTWVAMPRAVGGPYDLNWLPTPLEELEQPIPVTMRDKIVTRFVARHRMSGYFVQALGGYNVPQKAQAWILFLSRFYDIAEVAHSRNYRILRFSLRTPIISRKL